MCFGACGGALETPQPMGVLLISIDSLRADHLGSYGYKSPTRPGIPTTPAIDNLLAAQGTSFDRAFSTTSWTLPSHLAMLTGRPDELHGVLDLPDRLPANVPMLQQRFQASDWTTAGFWSGPNLHPWFGFDRGFDTYVDCSSRQVADPSIFALDDAEANHDALMELHEGSHQGLTGPKIVAAFDEWFSAIAKDEPFFAFAHFWDVHYDYTPPAEYDVFDPDYRGEVDGRDFMNLRIRANAPEDLNHLIALYDGELKFTDRNVEHILNTLSNAGRLDNTLVVLTADHGEAFAEHGFLGHKHSLYEEEVHVPLILRFPGVIAAGERVAEVVSLADIAPTILDLCDLPGLDGMWGRSLYDSSTATNLRPAPMELTSRADDRFHRAARLERLKVIQTEDELLLFDLAIDPREQRRLENYNKGVQAPLARARELWNDIDRAAQALDLDVSGEPLPDDLSSDLSAAGYLESQKEIEAVKE
ncbi:MAG: sulfatase [Planctomycetota bacterium]|nr:sulfatase [Planctomycetota bacterium]